uniref:Uncharacterized protein n=1 Tax=Macrostomum lignano TaxID=282301 RepID=A0A1I8IDA3_9PLAT
MMPALPTRPRRPTMPPRPPPQPMTSRRLEADPGAAPARPPPRKRRRHRLTQMRTACGCRRCESGCRPTCQRCNRRLRSPAAAAALWPSSSSCSIREVGSCDRQRAAPIATNRRAAASPAAEAG